MVDGIAVQEGLPSAAPLPILHCVQVPVNGRAPKAGAPRGSLLGVCVQHRPEGNVGRFAVAVCTVREVLIAEQGSALEAIHLTANSGIAVRLVTERHRVEASTRVSSST